MMSYSGNAHDVTNSFCRFEKFLHFAIFLLSFIVVRRQMAELDWGGGGFIGVSRTSAKLELKKQQTITQKMADQGWSDLHVVLT